MIKTIFITSLLGFAIVFIPTNFVFAQGMMGGSAEDLDGHTAREEAEGKAVWEKLQVKELACKDLDDNFGTLGEYFMGQMMGTSHEAMNTMMIQMLGEQGEEQTHVVMGKRLSGCDTSAAIPLQGVGFMPMMQMMMGNTMWGNSSVGWGFGAFGWVFMIFWWALVIVAIVAIIKWLTSQSRGTRDHGKSALDILKERYAKGEIDRKEFEDKKKDLS